MPATYTVGDGKTYATIQAAVNAIPGNLSGQGIQTVEVYAKAPLDEYSENLNINAGFTNMSATDYIDVVSMIAHGGLATGGIKIVDPGTTAYHIQLCTYTRIHGFVCKGTTRAGNHVGIALITARYVQIYNNIIYGYESPSSGGEAGGIKTGGDCGYGRAYNNIVYNIRTTHAAGASATGIIFSDNISGAGCKIYNNTVYNITTVNAGATSYGIRCTRNHVSWKYKNNVSMNCDTRDFLLQANNDVEYNCSSDGTADDYGGSGNIVDQFAADQFLHLTAGSENLHLKYPSICIEAGTDLSGEGFTDDIEGDTRPYFSAWDIGADELKCDPELEGLAGSDTINDAAWLFLITSPILPIKGSLAFDLNALLNAGDDFELQIASGANGSERIIATYKITSDGADLFIDGGGGVPVKQERTRLNIDDITLFPGEDIVIGRVRNSATDRDILFSYRHYLKAG